MMTYPQQKRFTRVGIISDTHGYLDALAIKSLMGVDLIVHAGDIDTPEVFNVLQKVAPVTAVRGNMDRGPWSDKLPTTELITIDKTILFALHDVNRLDLDPAAAGIHAVIYGHSHRPHLETKNGIVFINPGSASQPRHNHPPTVAIVSLRDGSLDVEFVGLGEA
jgi:putative phosphoesterase